MEKVLIEFLPDEVTFEAPSGASLLDAALDAGIFIPASCGGAGTCGRCKVKVFETVETSEIEKVPVKERAEGYVLACRSVPHGRCHGGNAPN